MENGEQLIHDSDARFYYHRTAYRLRDHRYFRCGSSNDFYQRNAAGAGG